MNERVEELIKIFDFLDFKKFINEFNQLQESEFEEFSNLEQVFLLLHVFNSYFMTQNQEKVLATLNKLEKNNNYTETGNPAIQLLVISCRIFYNYFVIFNFDSTNLNKLLINYNTLLNEIMTNSGIEGIYKNKIEFIFYSSFGLAFYKLNKHDKSIELLKKAYTIATSIKLPFYVQISYENLREALEYIHDLNQILEIGLRTKYIFIELKLELYALSMDNRIAYTYYNLGRIDEAKKLSKNSLDKLMKIKTKGLIYNQVLVNSYNNLGMIESWVGNYEKAIYYYKQCLELNQTSPSVLGCLSEIYLEKGEIEESIYYQKKCLEIKKELIDNFGVAFSYSVLIRAFLELNDIETCTQYLTLLKDLSHKVNDTNITLLADFSEAIILKKIKSLKNLSKAQEIFEQIVNRPMMNIEITSKSIIYLIELTLYEYNLSSDQNNFMKIVKLINSLHELGNRTKSNPVLIESLILKGKLEILEGNLADANEFFNESLVIAEKSKIVKLIEKAKNEQNNLNKEIKKWNSLIEANATLKEKIVELDMLDYIEDASKSL